MLQDNFIIQIWGSWYFYSNFKWYKVLIPSVSNTKIVTLLSLYAFNMFLNTEIIQNLLGMAVLFLTDTNLKYFFSPQNRLKIIQTCTYLLLRENISIGDLNILRNTIILRFIGTKGYISSSYPSIDWYEWRAVITVCLIVYVRKSCLESNSSICTKDEHFCFHDFSILMK